MVRPEGLEPPTGGLEIRCSILLSYGRTARIARRPSVLQAHFRCWHSSPGMQGFLVRPPGPRKGRLRRLFGDLPQRAAGGFFLRRPAEVPEGYDPDEPLVAIDDWQPPHLVFPHVPEDGGDI